MSFNPEKCIGALTIKIPSIGTPEEKLAHVGNALRKAQGEKLLIREAYLVEMNPTSVTYEIKRVPPDKRAKKKE